MKHDEQQAFPSPPVMQHRYGPMGEHLDDAVWRGFPGMTLRDWFAGTATDEDVDVHRTYVKHGSEFSLTRAQARYRYADAMIKAREDSDKLPGNSWGPVDHKEDKDEIHTTTTVS